MGLRNAGRIGLTAVAILSAVPVLQCAPPYGVGERKEQPRPVYNRCWDLMSDFTVTRTDGSLQVSFYSSSMPGAERIPNSNIPVAVYVVQGGRIMEARQRTNYDPQASPQDVIASYAISNEASLEGLNKNKETVQKVSDAIHTCGME